MNNGLPHMHNDFCTHEQQQMIEVHDGKYLLLQ
jgi:hypothetical protein